MRPRNPYICIMKRFENKIYDILFVIQKKNKII